MDIKGIIKAFDDELIENDKRYLILAQANRLLVEKGLMSVSGKNKKSLKKLLENNKIPHAYQTSYKPKQWRIPLSKNGEKRKPKTRKKQKPKLKKRIQSTVCPACGINLTIPKEIINAPYIKCLNCFTEFYNPLQNKKVSNEKSETIKSKIVNENKTQRNWIIGIVIVLIIWTVGKFSDNSSSTSTLYRVNTTTYVGTNKANYDEMFDYISVGDESALSTLMLNGQVDILTNGTEVYIADVHFGYAVVRIKGSTRKYWIVREHITKK